MASQADSLSAADGTPPAADSLQRDTVRKPRAAKGFLDDPLDGKSTDSLVYDVRNKLVYIYNEGDVTYQSRNLKADYMQIDMNTKLVYAYGKPDSVDGVWTVTKPEFTEGSAAYQMDTITYNLDSQKAKIKGVATQQGDGWLVGGSVKKMPDNTFNIEHGKYTTCEETDHPHFYLAMTKAKVIPGKKGRHRSGLSGHGGRADLLPRHPRRLLPDQYGPQIGPADADLRRGVLQRFLPARSGLLLHAGRVRRPGRARRILHARLVGSLGRLALHQALQVQRQLQPPVLEHQDGRKGRTGLHQAEQFPHPVDPLAGRQGQPGIDLLGLGELRHQRLQPLFGHQYRRHSLDADQLVDLLLEELGRNPFSLSANMAISQNSQNKSISVTLPTVVFNVSRLYPFKRKERMGKERWYEKISMQYTGKMTNSVTTTESEIFSQKTLDNMKNGIEHSIPVSASFNLFNYINISPSFNYTEKWYFKKQEYQWNPTTNQTDTLASDYGFYRLYNYTASVSASTTLYGMYDFTKKRRDRKIQAIRHTITPSIGFSFAPDFSDPRYGYYLTRQTDSTGRFTTYSPYAVNAYGVPSSGKSMSMNFSLSQNLEMKVLSKRDTSGVKKIKLIDELRLSGSYNFLADSMKLSTISLSFRTTLFNNFGINLSATIDPYRVTPEGIRYDKLFLPGAHHLHGLVVRLHLQIARRPFAAGHQRHHESPAGLCEPLPRPLRNDGPRAAKAVHGPILLRLLAAVELRLQLRGELLDLLCQ